MDFAALFKIFQSWGPSAISSVLVIVVLYLIKRVDKNGEEDAKRQKGLTDLIDERVRELRDNMAKTLDEHGRKISFMEMEYVRRDTFYRELGGWKDDINRLSGQITTQFMEFMKNIVELWKGKGE
jgi:hypothetical protein